MPSRPIGPKANQPGLTGLTAGVGNSRTAKAHADRSAADAKGNDSVKVNISDHSKRLQEDKTKAFDIAKATSPVREDRVAELKSRIQNGQYKINAGNIADGMLKEAMKERIAEHS